jgi:hypothetical protein
MAASHTLRLKRSIEKNLADLNNCVLKRRAYNTFLAKRSAHSLDFFRIAMNALRQDMFVDACRVFDRHADAASFWYVQRVAPSDLARAAKAADVSLSRIELISSKLHPIRNRVLAHTDKKHVIDPAQVWKDAGLSGNEFNEIVEGGHEILRRMLVKIAGEDRPIPPYFGEDIDGIVLAYKTAR